MELFSHNCTRRKYHLSWLVWGLCLRGTRFSCRHGGREKNEAAGMLREGNRLAAMKYIQHKPWDSVALLGSQGARRLSGNAEQFLPALEISTCIQTQHWTSQLTRPCSGIWNSHVCTALIPQHIVLKGLGLLDCFPKASQVAASYPQKEGGKSQQYQLLYTSCKAIPAFDGWRAAWDPPLAELFWHPLTWQTSSVGDKGKANS